MSSAATLTLFIIALLYFLPTVIALMRQHKDAPAIAAVNILLGWSVIGWLVSFVWALTDPSGRRGGSQTVVINTTQSNAGALPALESRIPMTPRTAVVTAGPPDDANDRDTSFWDGLKDKSNPDDLEEYLLRFPQGKFAELARIRLQRKGIAAPVAALPPVVKAPPAPSAPATPRASRACDQCGGALEPGTRFCDDCGAAVAA
jgi:hypothetical protein